MYKFYWQNNPGGGPKQRGSSPASAAAVQPTAVDCSHGSSSSAGIAHSSAPQSKAGVCGEHRLAAGAMRRGGDPSAPSVPHRNGVTVRVKGDHELDNQRSAEAGPDTSAGNKTKHTPSGSHRVLLKLRRMSGGSGANSRPKSVPDASELLENNSDNPTSTRPPPPGGAFAAEIRLPMTTEISGGGGGSSGGDGRRMRSSKSMHQMFYYNKTWNERSLSKCMREQEHNYENIYSCDKDNNDGDDDAAFLFGSGAPVYENVRFQQHQSSHHHPFVSMIASPTSMESESLVIGQLTRSPRSSARSKRKPLMMGPGGEAANVNNNMDPFAKNLYRSKSCERPKMRDAVQKETMRLQENLKQNFSRISTNLQNKFGGGGSGGVAAGTSLTSSASMFLNHGGAGDSGGFRPFATDDQQQQVRQRKIIVRHRLIVRTVGLMLLTNNSG